MRIAVYGGDLTGLVVARILRGKGHSVTVIEREVPGQSATTSRFKYLERTDEVTALLDGMGVTFDEYTVSAGVMLHGRVVPCREHLTQAVHHAYWGKTRMTSAPEGPVLGVIDPEVGTRRKAVALDWRDLRRPLMTGATIRGEAEDAFDLKIETRPLWKSHFVSCPDAMAVTLNMIPIRCARDRYLRWDLVYTPFTPADCVHRIYHSNDGYVCEFSGSLDDDRLTSDLNFLFPDGWHDDGDIESGYGYLLPMIDRPVWPDGVRPIGRLAQWDEQVTMTRVIREAKAVGNGHA